MANSDVMEDDDFEKLLNSFINDSLEEESMESTPSVSAEERNSQMKSADAEPQNTDDSADEEDDELQEDEIDYTAALSPEDQAVNDYISQNDMDEALVSSLQDAKAEAQNTIEEPTLGNDESELAQAFMNYYNSVNKLALTRLNTPYMCTFSVEDLYPNYKPSVGHILSGDVAAGWVLLCKIFPEQIGTFPLNSSDEEFLSFAEKLTDNDLQLAVISYVEILIDIEGCELTYQAKFLKYQEKHIKRIMYEEYMNRKERQRKFTEALAAKNFPVDADKLISNYFRVAQKDVDGAFKALTTNPAIFAPIDFSKIKPRWFGLVKVTPKDGIRINSEIGNFLKRLKV